MSKAKGKVIIMPCMSHTMHYYNCRYPGTICQVSGL